METLPVMTFAKRTSNCSSFWPIPTYKTFEYMELGLNPSWDKKFKEWEKRFGTLKDKIPKAIWRGKCSSGGHGSHHRHILITKGKIVNNQRFMDVRPYKKELCPGNLQDFVGEKMATEDSMLYRAVLDIDGNSWSERFPRLLCYNSVVVKVDVFPDHDEYFMPSLTPGKHYIAADLVNFTHVVKTVVSNKSLGAMQEVVKNANNWCRNFMVRCHFAFASDEPKFKSACNSNYFYLTIVLCTRCMVMHALAF
jgi:hypothetical protein